ncbi:MAG TPA: uroporphyrinogen decarboxylase family protein [Desulfomonilia bacterium]
MNARQRIDAVLALQKPDRVPVAPLLDHYAATYSGYTNAEIMTQGDKRITAIIKTATELGPWDMTFLADTANAVLLQMGVAAKIKIPGRDLPENAVHQFEETEFLTPDDYSLLAHKGTVPFLMEVMGRLNPAWKGLRGFMPLVRTLLEYRKHVRMVRARGMEAAVGFIHPGVVYEYFSLGRGITAMSADTFKRKDDILAAGRVWAKGMADMAIMSARFTGVPRVFIGMSRASPDFISRRNFEELVLPDLEYTVNRFVAADITPVLHCDTNWTRFFELFLRFPARKCILELDGKSDIFKAKEMLGRHMCIMGDVPAELLVLGSKEEVMDYCRRLIEEVGKGGGFILSSGCSLPANAKKENVRALYEAAQKWGRY